jgi:hypothetical protein
MWETRLMMNRSYKVLLGVMARSPLPELDVTALCTTGDGQAAEIGSAGWSNRASTLASASAIIRWIAAALLRPLGGR